MGLFRNRPFAATLASVVLVALLLCGAAVRGLIPALSDTAERCLAVTTVAVGIFSLVLLIVLAVRSERCRVLCIVLSIAVVFITGALLRFGSYFVFGYARAQAMIGKTVSVTLTVKECETNMPGHASYFVDVESATYNGEALPSGFRAVLRLDTLGEYRPGDRLSVRAECVSIRECYVDSTSALSNGLFLGLLPIERIDPALEESTEVTDTEYEITVLSYAEDAPNTLWGSLAKHFRAVRKNLSRVFVEHLGTDVGNFTSAVLLGEREALGERLRADFSRAGISHILAISGLHMTVLIGGFTLFLRKLTLHRKLISVCTLIAIFIFLLLTGFPLSACRAGLMLAVVAVAGFFLQETDPVTSLFFALAVIMFVDPSATVSAGLWMSFASVLGLVLLAQKWEEYLREREKEREKEDGPDFRMPLRALFRMISTSVVVSLIANFSILPVLWAIGEEFPLYSILSNLLTVFLMPAFLLFAILFLLFHPLNVFGALTAFVLRTIGNWILSVASAVASIPGATVSLCKPYATAAVFIFLVPTVLLLVLTPETLQRIKEWICSAFLRRRTYRKKAKATSISARWFLIPPLCAVLVYTVGMLLSARTAAFTVVDASSGEMLIVENEGDSVLFDLSDGRYRGYSNAATVAKEQGITEWTAVVLTHYHTRQLPALSRFCKETRVKTVYLPVPCTDADAFLIEALCEKLDASETPYIFYMRETEIRVDSLSVFLSEPVYLERSTQPIYYLSLTFGKERLTYMTQSIAESALCERAFTRESTALVFGSDGPTPQSVLRIPDGALENCKTILSYGKHYPSHFHSETRSALDKVKGTVWIHGETPLRVDGKEKNG
ncbi:MAG: ComEC/Rec2 family competence protein [Clostridia bacterium]|nr:ComEC/Rec2 family competence protein [Clostridia bacterium]